MSVPEGRVACRSHLALEDVSWPGPAPVGLVTLTLLLEFTQLPPGGNTAAAGSCG